MAWHSRRTVAFTRIAIVSEVPPSSGVFAVRDGTSYLLVGESWNLRARLLDLANALEGPTELHIDFELCPEDQRETRKNSLSLEYLADSDPAVVSALPGLHLREGVGRTA